MWEKAVVSRLEGRRIIITGAASGIGAATARLFRSEGAQLVLVDKEQEGLEAIAREIDAFALRLDLTDLDAIEPAVSHAAETLNGLDGVVNCAGIGSSTPIEEVSLAYLQRIIAVNLSAPYLVCRAALPYLRKSKNGTIVNIASGQGILPSTPNSTPYAASKGGLVTFTKSLAVEVAPLVRANVVCPGLTNTPLTQQVFVGHDDLSDAPAVKQYPLKRAADPNEIAMAILFLTSAESSYVTGAALAVDGGRTLH